MKLCYNIVALGVKRDGFVSRNIDICLIQRKNANYISGYAKEIIETESYKALQKIKEIIQDSSLDDKECFMKIEEIVCIFEALGGSVGNRLDVG